MSLSTLLGVYKELSKSTEVLSSLQHWMHTKEVILRETHTHTTIHLNCQVCNCGISILSPKDTAGIKKHESEGPLQTRKHINNMEELKSQ